MKNLRKVLALVLALAIVLSTFTTAFAAEAQNTEKATTLNTLGLYLGTSTNEFVPALEEGATRAQAIVLIGRALGWTVDSTKVAIEKFADVPAWAAPYVAVAIEKGVTDGVSEDSFGADQAVTLRQVYTWYYRALGFTGDVWANPSLLVSAKLATQEVVNGLVSAALTNKEVGANRDALVGVMFESLNWSAKDKTTTLIADLVAAGKVDEAKAVATKVFTAVSKLDVAAVAMNGYKEVILTFNEAPVKADAEKTTNYVVKVGETEKGVSSAAVSADGKVVTLTLADGQEVAQADTVSVKVLKAIGMVADVTKSVASYVDSTFPTVTSVELTGPKSIKLTFSEALKENIPPTVLINNGAYGASVANPDGREVLVSLPGLLSDGDYTITISGATDFANLKMASVDKTLAYKKVTTEVTASVAKATQKSVTIKFSQALVTPVAMTVADFYHTYTSFKPDSIKYNADGTEITLEFSTYAIAEGTWNLTILKDHVESQWGNKVAANIVLPVSVSLDKVAPTVALSKVNAENEIVLLFADESGLAATTVQAKANYTLKDKDGKVVDKVSGISFDSETKKATVTFTEKLAGGNYSLVVKDVTDNTMQANKIAETVVPFAVTDLTAPAPTKAEYVLADGIVYVTFNEAMGASALDVNNWLVNDVVPKTAVVFNGDAKVIKLTLENKANVSVSAIKVGPVSDVAGNKIKQLATSITNTELSAVNFVSAKSIAENKVEIVLGGKIVDGVKASNFTFWNGATSAQAAYVSFVINDKNQTVVTAVMNSAVTFAASSAPSKITVAGLKADTGIGATTAAFTAATDGIAPSVSAKTTTISSVASVTTATITFNEDLATTYAAFFASDLVVTYDGKELKPYSEYTVVQTPANHAELTITLKVTVANGKEITVKTKDVVNYLLDQQGNKAAAIDYKITVK